MSFEDPLARGHGEDREEGERAATPDSAGALANIEATMEAMLRQLQTLTQDVEALKQEPERPSRAALPAVETPLEDPESARVGGDGRPSESADARLAAAEQARLEAERLQAAAEEARRRAQEAAEEAERAAQELQEAEARLEAVADEVEAREGVRERAEVELAAAREAVQDVEHRLKEARVDQVKARDFVEQARSFQGAETMVQEAERLLEAEERKVKELQEELDAARGRQARAEEELGRADERLGEAREQMGAAEREVRRLHGEAEAASAEATEAQTEAPDAGEVEEVEEADQVAPAEPSYAEEPASEAVETVEAPVAVESFESEREEPASAVEAPAATGPAQATEEAEEVEEPMFDEDEISRTARLERERLEAELRGESLPAPAPAVEPMFEEDEEARRLAEQTQAEISGEPVGFGFEEPVSETPEPESYPPSPLEPQSAQPDRLDQAQEAGSPWEEEPAAPTSALPWEQPGVAAEEPYQPYQEPAPAAEAPMPWEQAQPDAPAYESYEETIVPGDHVPAYADLEAETGVPLAPGAPGAAYESAGALATREPEVGLPEPTDILYAIASDTGRDVDEPAAAPARQIVQATRAAEETRRGKKAKPKFEALPYDLLVPKQPLIAAFFSPSGGVGKSSTTLNVAALMAAIGAKQAADAEKRGMAMQTPRVLALDGDVVQGSLALRLTGETKPSMHTLQLYLDAREDQGFVGRERWPQTYKLGSATPGEEPMQKFVHWPDRLANLNLLAAPDDPDKFYDFGPEEYRELLELLGQFYDVILIDCGTEVVMESNRAWLQHAHAVFMLCTPELDRMWNASKAMGYIAKSRPDPEDRSEQPKLLPPLVTREKVSIVMTSSDAETGINLTGEELVAEFFPYIDERQRFFIPDVSRELRKANNAHDFLVLNDQRFAKAVMEIAKHCFNRYASSTRALSSGR